MKVKLTFLALVSLLSMPLTAQQNAKAELDASNIIKFCNSVIGLNNKNRTSADNYNQILSTADSNMEKLEKSPNTQPVFVDYKSFAGCLGDQKEYQLAYQNAPAFPEKKDINDALVVANKDIQNAVKWATSISNYFSEKKFVTDTGFTQYLVMEDSLTHYFQKGYNGWATASKLATKAGNNAELILLQGSKIAQFVIPMKSDINQLEAILKSFNDDTRDTNQIKADLQAVSQSVAKNKDISNKDVKKLSDANYKEVYQKFYTQCEETIKSMSAFNNELAANPESNRLKSLYSYATANYHSVVESYNTFIRQ